MRGLWYGALDMTDRGSGITPVLKLDGLDGVRRWVDSLNRFDGSGDYGVFAPLLIRDGMRENIAECLERAAFHERTLNLSSAAQQIRMILPILDEPLQGASELFREQLSSRLAWARQDDLAEHQRQLAFEYLKRRDFIRAAMFGWEALVTRECSERQYNISDFGCRRQAIEDLEAEINEGQHMGERQQAFSSLRKIRNALAHGNPPWDRRTRAILGNVCRLKCELDKTFRCLLNQGGEM